MQESSGVNNRTVMIFVVVVVVVFVVVVVVFKFIFYIFMCVEGGVLWVNDVSALLCLFARLCAWIAGTFHSYSCHAKCVVGLPRGV